MRIIIILGDVGHIEQEANDDVSEEMNKLKQPAEDPHHILKHISQIQPVTTI